MERPVVTGVTLSRTALPAYSCCGMVVESKVSGWFPKTLENRSRIVLPHRSGLTMERMVWSFAPLVFALGKANARSGWMLAVVNRVGEGASAWFCGTGATYTKYAAGDVAQLATQCWGFRP